MVQSCKLEGIILFVGDTVDYLVAPKRVSTDLLALSSMGLQWCVDALEDKKFST